jgi:hypothetical protein
LRTDFLRASSRGAPWLLACAALSAAPFACSDDKPARPLEGDAKAPAFAASPDGHARIEAIARLFPSAFPATPSAARLDAAPGGGLRAQIAPGQAPRGATVELPPMASLATRVIDEASRLAVSFALEGASAAPAQVAGDVALYAGALGGGGDLLHRASASGTEDFAFFPARPTREELRYRVDVGAARGLRLVADTLEFLDAGGAPLVRVSPPYVISAGGEVRAARLAVLGCAFDASPRPPWGREVTPPGAASCVVVIDFRGASVRYPALVDPVWGTTLNVMGTPRTRHSMTLLNPADAKSLALVAGGFSTASGAPLKSAEIYDPLSRRFSVTGSLATARGAHTATLLTSPTQPAPGAPVLVAGGSDGAGTPLDSLEVYDQGSGVFVTDANKMAPRLNFTATLVADAKVLLAGGISLPLNQPTNTAQLYAFTAFAGSPVPTGVTSTVASTQGTMASSRAGHAAVRLKTGDVLVSGGFVLAGGALQALQTAELYRTATNAWSPITTAGGGLPTMSFQRGFHTATLLADGLVLIAGGLSKTVGGIYTSTVDLYADGAKVGPKGFVPQLVPITMATGRSNHTATLLPTGEVLIAGGFNGGSAIAAEERFIPASQSFAPLAALVPMTARGDHAAILVNAGDSVEAGRTVLVSGGSTSPTPGAAALASAQILLRTNGEGCTKDEECLSGRCADVSNLANPTAGKMCCDTACNEVCKSCSAQGKGSGPDGFCGFASGTTVLGWKCVPKTNEEVEILQGCDGNGNVIPFQTNRCTPNRCNGDRCANDCPCSDAGFCTDAAVETTVSASASSSSGATTASGAGVGGGAASSGSGGAGGGGGATGSGGAGGAGSATSTSSTTSSSATTTSSGGGPDAGASLLHCEDRRPVGLACAEGRQCDSGYCVDGYCCNVACTGQCEACDVPGKIGVCSNVGSATTPEDPHLGSGSIDFAGKVTSREACAGDGTGCVGKCRGADALHCIYPGGETTAKPPACAASGAGFTTTAYRCDGKGTVVGTPSSCEGFKCQDATACKATCATDDDCIGDYVCLVGDASAKACRPLEGPLCDGKFTLRRPAAQGGNLKCADHYTCPEGSDHCRTDCDSVNDCVDGFVCNGDRKCVEQIVAPPLPGCACSAVGEAPSGAPTGLRDLAVIGVAAAFARGLSRRRENARAAR